MPCRVLLRGDRLRGVEKFVIAMSKPAEYLAPHSMVTGCDTVAWAMINNCDTNPSQPTEILDNHQIYKLCAEKKERTPSGGSS